MYILIMIYLEEPGSLRNPREQFILGRNYIFMMAYNIICENLHVHVHVYTCTLHACMYMYMYVCVYWIFLCTSNVIHVHVHVHEMVPTQCQGRSKQHNLLVMLSHGDH